MDNIIQIFLLITVGIGILISSLKDIFDLVKLKKDKNKPYYCLNFMKYLISFEIQALVLCVIIFFIYIIFKGGLNLNDIIIDILINIGCSIATTVVLSTIIYFRFLKRIPDDTKKQIDNLLNARLGYETTNHNATLEKFDSIQHFLSKEHGEIRQGINSAKEGILSLNHKFDSDKEQKKMQYEYLNDNNKIIIDNIRKISNLGDVLEKVNYENKQLKLKNKELLNENSELKSELKKSQILHNSFTQDI